MIQEKSIRADVFLLPASHGRAAGAAKHYDDFRDWFLD
jgi:hypothetical protein